MAKLFEIRDAQSAVRITFDACAINGVHEDPEVDGRICVMLACNPVKITHDYATFCTAWKEALREPETFLGVDALREQRIEAELEQLREKLADTSSTAPIGTCVQCGNTKHEPYTCALAAQMRATRG